MVLLLRMIGNSDTYFHRVFSCGKTDTNNFARPAARVATRGSGFHEVTSAVPLRLAPLDKPPKQGQEVVYKDPARVGDFPALPSPP